MLYASKSYMKVNKQVIAKITLTHLQEIIAEYNLNIFISMRILCIVILY